MYVDCVTACTKPSRWLAVGNGFTLAFVLILNSTREEFWEEGQELSVETFLLSEIAAQLREKHDRNHLKVS